MTVDSKERTLLSTARSYGGLVGGSLIGFLIPIFAYQEKIVDGEVQSIFLGERMFVIALILGVIAIISFFILVQNVEERVVHTGAANNDESEEKFSYIEALKGFVKNKAALALSLNALFQMIFVVSSMQLGTITFQLYFRDGSLSSFLTLTQIIPLVVGSVIGPSLIGKYGKKLVLPYRRYLHP